jgi:hypothetical protein
LKNAGNAINQVPLATVTGLDLSTTTPLLNDTQLAALAKIQAHAADNGAAAQLDPSKTPTLADFTQLGVTGIGGTGQPTVAMINSVLVDPDITGTLADTVAKVQAIVDAYAAILAEANDANPDAGDNTPDTSTADPTAAQYAAIGADIGSATTDAENLALLNDIVGASQFSDVDSVAKLNDLARIANAIQAIAADPATVLTVENYAQIGLSGVSANNLASVRAAIAAQANNGSATDSLAKLQTLIDNANDAPVNTVPTPQTTNEDTAKVIAGLSISDVDAGSSSVTVTLAVTNGTINVGTGTDVTLTGNNSASVTLTGTVANINALLATTNAVTYAPTLHFNGTDTLTMTTNDGGLSDSDTVSININAVNDAPTGLGNLTLAAIDEGTVSPAGAAINTLGGLNFADVDSGASLGGVAVVGNTASAGTQGVWQYSTNAGTNWSAIGTVDDTTGALALSAATLVRFVPVVNYSGTPPSLTVRALDNSYAGSFSTTGATETRATVTTSTNPPLGPH